MMKLAFLILGIVTLASAKPDGAPKTACSSLMPRHGNIQPQTSESPYKVLAWKSGKEVRIRIWSPSKDVFRGFMLQARSTEDPNKFIDGVFTSSEVSNATNCFNGTKNTLTHVTDGAKEEVLTKWIPNQPVDEDVIFRATVARTWDVFWVKVDSPPVHVGNMSVHIAEWNDTYSDCLFAGNCLGIPSDCVQNADCDIILKYYKTPEKVVFHIFGYINSLSYMAMAFSDDDRMGGDTVTECVRNGSRNYLRESWNEGKRNILSEVVDGKFCKGRIKHGMTSCTWSVPYVFKSNGRYYDLTEKNYHILLATGVLKPDGALDYHDKKAASKESINFTYIGGPGSKHENYHVCMVKTLVVKKEIPTNETLNYGSSSPQLGFNLGLILCGLFCAAKELFIFLF